MNNKIKELSDVDNNEGKIYFNNELKEVSTFKYIFLVFSIFLFFYIFYLNWIQLSEYEQIRSVKNYPMLEIKKEQISYFGNNFIQFKKDNDVNKFLIDKELDNYWVNCIGNCEIPDTRRFKNISQNQNFINWACNERIKEFNFTGLKYAIWKLDTEGCVLTNYEELKKKDEEEINNLKLLKKKEMLKYITVLLIYLLCNLFIIKKIMNKKIST